MSATRAGGWASFHGGHSRFGDGRDEIDAIARSALDRGFVAFGFTEHFEQPPMRRMKPPGTLGSRPAGWLDEYVAAVRAAPGPVLLGTEVEYIRGQGDWTRSAVARYPFDYVVGSVHFVRYDDDICIDCSRELTEEALRRAGSAERFVLDYYDHVLELVKWRLVHVVGHLDVVKIFLTPAEREPTPAVRAKVDAVLQAIRDAGIAMDVNARGLVKPCAEVYPAPWILERAARAGVPVTLGDDSHGPEDVGLNLDRAVDALRAAGYDRMWLVRPGGVLEEGRLPA